MYYKQKVIILIIFFLFLSFFNKIFANNTIDNTKENNNEITKIQENKEEDFVEYDSNNINDLIKQILIILINDYNKNFNINNENSVFENDTFLDLDNYSNDKMLEPYDYNEEKNYENNIINNIKKYGKKNNIFPAGYCTYYVANNKNVFWNGNAKDWYYNALKKGVSVGKKPREGAIVVFFGKGYNKKYGHVAIVKKINNDHFIVSEMNVKGKGIISERKVKINDKKIIGFIYAEDLSK